MDRKKLLVAEIRKMTTMLRLAVEAGEKQYEEMGGLQFSRNSGATEKGIRRLIEPVWNAYHDLFIALGVKNRSETLQLSKSFEQDDEVQRCVQELLRAEEVYNAFTKKVDGDVQKHEDTLVPDDPLEIGSTLPNDLCLTDLSSGKSVSLESYWKQSPYTLFILERHYA